MIVSEELRTARAAYEIRRRLEVQEQLDRLLFAEQLAFLNDPAKLKAALTTRRAGKSIGAAAYLLREALRFAGCSVLYIGLTCDSAIKIIWKDCLRVLCRKLGIRAKLNRQKGEVRIPNGSIIYITGVDATAEQQLTIFGQKFPLVVVDEAALYSIDLQEFIFETLFPCVSDYDGTICLIGMPSKFHKRYFADVTRGSKPGWSVHKWGWWNNPHVATIIDKQLAKLRAEHPGIEQTPGYKRSWLGLWAVDASSLVYRYDASRNLVPELPRGEMRHVLGIDLGYSPDPTAFILGGYRPHDRKLYFHHAYKRTGMILSDVATYIRYLQGTHNIERLVIDNANKQAVEEMSQRHGLAFEAAEKQGKADFIEMMNDDFQLGNIAIVADKCSAYTSELEELAWDERKREKGLYIEDPSLPNHCCDGGLYVWRFCLNWVDRGPRAEAPSEEDRMMSIAEQRAEERAEAEGAFWS